MSEHENNKMEAWLKAYRQQRLDQWNEAPVELDEPTRAMLMAEVRRQNPATHAIIAETTPASEPTFGWLRWALGGMTAAIVALGISSLSQFQSESDSMAQANPGSPESNSQIKAGTADAVSRDEAKASAEAETAVGVMGGMNRGMAAKGSVPGSPGNSGTVQAVPSQIAPSQPAPRPTPVRNMPSRQNIAMENGNYYNHVREMQLNFAQQSRARSGIATSRKMAKQKELPKPVLVNFELKRVGNTIRVLDGDGSIYTGAVINEETLPEAEELQAMALGQPGEGGEGGGIARSSSAGAGGFAPGKPVADASKLRRGSQAFFRVQGTNKTLKQLVILEATLDNLVFNKKDADKPAAAMATRPASPPKPGIAPSPAFAAPGAPKNLNRNMGAIRAIARMRVLGNARIGKENYPVDAYLDTKAVGKAPADIKKK
jgi:hypothetical protein